LEKRINKLIELKESGKLDEDMEDFTKVLIEFYKCTEKLRIENCR
jgi:hypothetical protein